MTISCLTMTLIALQWIAQLLHIVSDVNLISELFAQKQEVCELRGIDNRKMRCRQKHWRRFQSWNLRSSFSKRRCCPHGAVMETPLRALRTIAKQMGTQIRTPRTKEGTY